jgi:hypothetical protein
LLSDIAYQVFDIVDCKLGNSTILSQGVSRGTALENKPTCNTQTTWDICHLLSSSIYLDNLVIVIFVVIGVHMNATPGSHSNNRKRQASAASLDFEWLYRKISANLKHEDRVHHGLIRARRWMDINLHHAFE